MSEPSQRSQHFFNSRLLRCLPLRINTMPDATPSQARLGMGEEEGRREGREGGRGRGGGGKKREGGRERGGEKGVEREGRELSEGRGRAETCSATRFHRMAPTIPYGMQRMPEAKEKLAKQDSHICQPQNAHRCSHSRAWCCRHSLRSYHLPRGFPLRMKPYRAQLQAWPSRLCQDTPLTHFR